MTRRFPVLLGCLLATAACGSDSPDTETTGARVAAPAEAATGPALMALHLYNPGSEEAHMQFVAGLSTLNQAVIDAGHPETAYQVWKVAGEQSGDYEYLFGSIWSNRAAYDAAHAHEAYTTAMAALEGSGIENREEVYNRYVQLSAPVEDPAPMPGGGPPILALHRFNLPSADSEAELLTALEDLNAAVAAAGHPETRYILWKVTGEQAGERAYLFGSLWSEQATYDAVHAHPAYESAAERHREAFSRLILDEIYNRYAYVGPN